MAVTNNRKSTGEMGPNQIIAWGVIFLFSSVGAYFYLHHAEQVGGTVTLPIIVAPVYKLLGTWGIVGLLIAFGLFCLAGGFVQVRTARRGTRDGVGAHTEQG